jgi:hypothetical protein
MRARQKAATATQELNRRQAIASILDAAKMTSPSIKIRANPNVGHNPNAEAEQSTSQNINTRASQKIDHNIDLERRTAGKPQHHHSSRKTTSHNNLKTKTDQTQAITSTRELNKSHQATTSKQELKPVL